MPIALRRNWGGTCWRFNGWMAWRRTFIRSRIGTCWKKLSAQTGGRYWKPDELKQLPSEISYSEAGISVRDTKELWNMPIVFLVLLALAATEWLLRRKWGIV